MECVDLFEIEHIKHKTIFRSRQMFPNQHNSRENLQTAAEFGCWGSKLWSKLPHNSSRIRYTADVTSESLCLMSNWRWASLRSYVFHPSSFWLGTEILGVSNRRSRFRLTTCRIVLKCGSKIEISRRNASAVNSSHIFFLFNAAYITCDHSQGQGEIATL